MVEIAWAKNGTPDTLSSASNPLEITDLTAKQFNQFMCHSFKGDGTYAAYTLEFNENTNTVYATRTSTNGGADSTSTSQTYMNLGNNVNFDHFQIVYTISISGEEKLVIAQVIDANTAGATNVPARRETVGKFVPSPDADITEVEMGTAGSNNGTGSNLSALGTD